MSTEWPVELLEIFADPLFAETRIHERPTTSDRIVQGYLEIASWVEEHGRIPHRDDADLQSARMAMRLDQLRREEYRALLLPYDELNLLGFISQ